MVLETALKKHPHISIYGNDYDTPDGTCVRDYIHVEDLAQAHVAALTFLKNDKRSESFNLGTGKGFSVKEIIKEAERLTGKEIPFVICDKRRGDPAKLIAVANKAKQAFEWVPRQSNLENIIKTAWNWYKNFGH